MEEAILYFFNDLFPVHMYFALQILVAELMFVIGQKKRSLPGVRIPVCIALYLLLTFFHPTMGDRFIRVLCIFGWSYLFLLVVLDASPKCCLFISIAAYAIQNLAFNLGTLFLALMGMGSTGNGNISSAWGYLGATLAFIIVYVACYFILVHRFNTNVDELLGNTSILILSAVTVFIVWSKNAFISWGWMDNESALSMFTTICCILVLILQFGLLYQKNMEYQNKVVEQLLQAEKERYEKLKENMEIVNTKCHDLRFNVRQYRECVEGEHDEFFRELEDSIRVYDSIANTGNDALDTLLTDQLLYCGQNGIDMSYIVDAGAISKMELSDVYSLFGNALENAVHAVMKEDTPARVISLSVRRQGNLSQITIVNSCTKPPEFVNGLPVSDGDRSVHGYGMRSMEYIAKKYSGVMKVECRDGVFSLGILLQQ